ncbi:MAG: hypothetical protein LBQ66_01320 [Planctomycetaceae bacterium]|nr:hypothetical protein [Planctomycetaceae bacterium]
MANVLQHVFFPLVSGVPLTNGYIGLPFQGIFLFSLFLTPYPNGVVQCSRWCGVLTVPTERIRQSTRFTPHFIVDKPPSLMRLVSRTKPPEPHLHLIFLTKQPQV